MPHLAVRTRSARLTPRWAGTAVLAFQLAIADGEAGTGKAPRRIAIVPQPEGAVLRLDVGKPRQLSARAELANGTVVPLDGHVTWNSSNPSVLRLTRGDATSPVLITPLRPGIASVTITYPPVSGARPPHPAERVLGDALTVIVQEGR